MQNRFSHHYRVALIVMIATIFSVKSFGQDPQKAKMTPFGRGYLEYLPTGYSSSTAKYPTIIFLHGSGERGTGTAADLEKVKRQGPPKHISSGHKMGFTVNGKTEYFIVLSPQTNDWSWKYDVVPFVQWAVQNYRIDPDRIFVTGLSMGGEGTWFSAGLDDNSPNLFAAIAVMAGRGSLLLGSTVATRHLNVWAFHGDADTSLGIGGGLLPITGMLNLGANPAPIWTVYPGVGHGGCWDRAYRTDHTYHNPNVYEWFLTKRKPGATSTPPPAPAPPPVTAPPPVSSTPPVVNAGADKTITLPSSTSSFTASASDSDGQIKSYSWTQVSGPSATLSNTTTKTLSVTKAVTNGTYIFRITVKDNASLQASDDVKLTVNAAGSSSGSNKSPIVDAGDKITITLPSNSASFTANASDPDGSIASYSWTKIGGGNITMSGTTSKTLSLSNAVQSTYVFRVEVTDNKGAKAADTVRLSVKAAVVTTNKPPVVSAGDKKTITLPTNSSSFTAVASDPDGSIASYQWTKIGGGVITMSGANTATLSLKSALVGTYVFEVLVKDNKGATSTAIVRLAVRAAVASLTPEATWEIINNNEVSYAALTQE
jgi:dienelactone hydrolase